MGCSLISTTSTRVSSERSRTLNQGQQPAYGETTSDFPQHLTTTLIYQLPFGRGRAFANQSRLADAFIGGWQATMIYQALSGTPIQWGNVIYTGNWHDLNNHPHQAIGPSFNTSVFDRRVRRPAELL